MNVSADCIDGHLAERGEQPAIIWAGDDPSESRIITYARLHEEVCRFANVLRSQAMRRGERVMLYLPMIPEAKVAIAIPASSSPPTKGCAAAKRSRLRPMSTPRSPITARSKRSSRSSAPAQMCR
ncbi:AMP-binding protein [Sphingobium sp. Leaf26]|uniref:AMP-binding protein n=1 Tax=Sphingobium sp. Leaf26 TaxID=1735693 RepID=UPI003FA79355